MRTTISLLFLWLLSSTGIAQFMPSHGYSSRLEPTSDPMMEVVKSTSAIQDTVFYTLYGGPNQEEAKDFVETFDKGFLICGSSSSYGQGGSTVYVVKTDSLGRFKWGRTYGGINADRGMSIRNTPDSGAYITGFSNSFGNFDYDAYCARIDSAGNLLWYRTYDGGDWDFLYGSDVTAGDGLVMAGETYSNTAGDADAYLVRINGNGDTLWTRKFGTPYHEQFNTVIVFNNDIYAAGKLFDPVSQTDKGFIARYSATGVLLDTLTLPSAGNWNYEVKCINTNGPYLFASGGIVDPNAPSGMQQSEFRADIDSLLNFIWIQYPGFAEVKVCNYVFKDNRDHQIAVMTQTGGNGKTAMFLADFYAGMYQCGYTYGGLEEDEGVKGMITSRNKLAFLGNTYSWAGSWNNGDKDFWLVLFKADTLIPDHKVKYWTYNDTISLSPIAIEELSSTGTTLFPNPVSKNSLITLKQANPAAFSTMEIIDIQGRKVAELGIEGQEKIQICPNMFGMEGGMYFVRLNGKQSAQTLKIAVQD